MRDKEGDGAGSGGATPTERSAEATRQAGPAPPPAGGGHGPPTPTDPALDPAYRHFREGNFREARRIALELSRSETPAIREAALALAERLRPDPAALWIAAGCLLLFIVVIWLTLF